MLLCNFSRLQLCGQSWLKSRIILSSWTIIFPIIILRPAAALQLCEDCCPPETKGGCYKSSPNIKCQLDFVVNVPLSTPASCLSPQPKKVPIRQLTRDLMRLCLNPMAENMWAMSSELLLSTPLLEACQFIWIKQIVYDQVIADI